MCFPASLNTIKVRSTQFSGKIFLLGFFSGDWLECSLPLQMLLYFDAIFFPFWALTIGSVFHIKVKRPRI
jgi:hypothetical protein